MTDIVFEAYSGGATATIDAHIPISARLTQKKGSGGADIAAVLGLHGDIVGKSVATINAKIPLAAKLTRQFGEGGVDISGSFGLAGHTFQSPSEIEVTALSGQFGVTASIEGSYVATIHGEIPLFARLNQKHGVGGADLSAFVTPSAFLLRELNYVGGFNVYMSPGYLYIRDLNDATNKYLFDRINFQASTPAAQAVLQLLDSIAMGDSLSQQLNLHAEIAASIVLGDKLLGGAGGLLSDSLQFADDTVALAIFVATLLDSFAVAAEATGTAAIFAFLSDSFVLDDSVDVMQQILQALQDGIEFGMTLYTGADVYTAWVMTPETRAMRSYSNYAFNSYAQFGGKLYGAKDDGIYVLEGDTDAGQEIYASVRSGLLDFGSRQLKRVNRAYLGYTADGTLALRVTTTSPQGAKVDYTYRMVKPPQADAPRETRVQIGKGLQSVYWAFELDNSLDGGNFELHDVTVLPIILSRKVR